MKLFDKFNGGSEDEEVELRPDSKKREASRVNAGPASSGEKDTAGSDDEETALLPGAVGGESGSSTTSSDTTGNDGDLEEQIQRVIEQNERIIELLETISSVSSGASDRSRSADTGNDELW